VNKAQKPRISLGILMVVIEYEEIYVLKNKNGGQHIPAAKIRDNILAQKTDCCQYRPYL
jgi:hypothetical protein